MGLARYFVFQNDDRWIVALDGATVAVHANRDEALQSAIIMADLMGSMGHDADVLVELDGRVDIAWTYGVDTVPGARAAA